MERHEELIQAVEEFTRVHNQWVDDANVEHPTLDYWRALDLMIHTFDSGELPAESRALAGAVYELGEEQAKFDSSEEMHPGNSFWHARERLEDELKKVQDPDAIKYRESVQELHAQKVPLEQIARMWGLTNSDGSGKAHLIQKELNEPGSVITPDYVHPEDREHQARAIEAKRRYEMAGRQRQEQQEAEEQPCPETPEELWLQGVTVRQSSKMLKRDVEEVEQMWADFERAKGGQSPPVGDFEEEENQYSQFTDWSDDDIKEHAKGLGLNVRGRYNRRKMLDRILEIEAERGAEEPPQHDNDQGAEPVSSQIEEGEQDDG